MLCNKKIKIHGRSTGERAFWQQVAPLENPTLVFEYFIRCGQSFLLLHFNT